MTTILAIKDDEESGIEPAAIWEEGILTDEQGCMSSMDSVTMRNIGLEKGDGICDLLNREQNIHPLMKMIRLVVWQVIRDMIHIENKRASFNDLPPIKFVFSVLQNELT